MPDLFCVVIGNGSGADCLMTTPSAREAVRAIDVVLLFAPTLHASVYVSGQRVLSVREGRWTVPTSSTKTEAA